MDSVTLLPTRIQTPTPMATLYCTETVPIAWTRTGIPTSIQIPDHYFTNFWDEQPYSDGDPSP